MKKLRLLLIFLIIALAGCNPLPEDTYKVVKIKDGDTIELLSHDLQNITVRLAGIDCPEKAQAFGTAARQYTAQLCFGQNVTLDGSDKDRYGRTVAYVILADGRNLNHELVKNGYAWEYKTYSKDPELAGFEQYARQNRLGLWQDENPVEPWNFRRNKTKNKNKKPRKKRRHKQEETVSLVSLYNIPDEVF
ncbi:thermonuclease family protein [Mucilaginibacter sp. UR6-1]|uniref:thermonuclease family protein n=1 Tax=Mucilaginibacter sp. UR6-1 TaxID=1435643 RepID=UPI001E5666C1|nr:thermonuclease family protein [Mucilaginibacter sp. UR6-1]MCC8409960.1 thermonuclease family protein [Mucilaginibacter sp. UR6-1]